MHTLANRSRTPEEHRVVVDAWRAVAPANDSQILPRDRFGTGRHPDMTDLVPALRTWRDLSLPREPLSSNWLAAPGNDNEEPFDAYEDDWADAPPPPSVDSELEVRPREGEIMGAVGDVEVAYSENDRGAAIPVGGDMDVHVGFHPVVIGGTPCAPLSRIGALRFGSGLTVERVQLRGKDGVIKRGDSRVTRGALTHCGNFPVRERPGKWRGSEDKLSDPQSLVAKIDPDDRLDADRLATQLRRKLSSDDVTILDLAMEARSFKQIGENFGRTGKRAEIHGKALLRAAASRLNEFLQSAA